MNEVFISTTTFGEVSKSPIDLLKKNDIKFSINPKKRKLTSKETYDYANNCDAIIAGTEDLYELVSNSKKLKFICRLGSGLENVPLDLCKKKEITVCNTPNALVAPVAELVVAQILNLYRNIKLHTQDLNQGKWKKIMGSTIHGATIGIIGFGKIGQHLASILSNFHPKELLICDPYINNEVVNQLSNSVLDIRNCNFEELIAKSDIISIHVPSTKETKNMFTLSEFKKMKNTAVIINTSRGGILNEKDLYFALHNEVIAGAGLDVFQNEPYTGDLIKLKNILLTPHVASSTNQARSEMEIDCVNRVISFFKNEHLLNKII